MCGYVGIVWKNSIRPENARAMLENVEPLLAHRGPDDAGFAEGAGFAVLHRRLSIIDITHGHQPMINDADTLGIAYNGEIYNYHEVKQRLEAKGVSFATNCDTEAFLKLFELEGVAAFDQLEGMYTAFIWDYRTNPNGEFYLARDHLGVKPLYLYEDSDKFVFCSEIYPILRLGDIDDTLDPQGIASYMTYRYCHAPNTFFQKIKRVEAGTYKKLANGNSSTWRFWDLPDDHGRTAISLEDASSELRSLLLYSVKQQQMSEVPVGLLLSGGLDSSAIAALCADAGVSMMSFNIGFPDLNEFEFSKDVANKFNLPHLTIETTPTEMKSSFSQVVRSMDEPIADPACFPLYLLCNSIKEHVTVIFSGEGSDELLGGYPQYPKTISTQQPNQDSFNTFLKNSWYFVDDSLNLICDPGIDRRQIHKKYFQSRSLLNGMLAYDLKTWLPENLMAKADKIAMSHSLEGRFPFLSKPIVEFVLPLAKRYKLGPNGGKRILRNAFEKSLPESVIERPKMGFSVPVDSILAESKSDVFAVLESQSRTPLGRILDIDALNHKVRRHFSGERPDPLWTWTLYVLLTWFDQYFSKSVERPTMSR